MKDSIYTIPISEVFEPMQGCPICRMRDMLEERSIEYIMGAAMMEPDVRVETNRTGFCEDHLRRMLPRKNRLSIGLMFQSHLDYLRKDIVSASAPARGKDPRAEKAREAAEGCYVCDRIQKSMDRMLDTTLRMWEKEESFRQLFAKQELLCFPHYQKLLQAAQGKLGKKIYPAFSEAIGTLALKQLNALKTDIDSFCNLFDYRSPSSGPVPEHLRTSIERTASYLCSRDFSEK
ncbi:MAG: hypothetical protein HFG26_09605 [Provencibacterium sp.]|nr:hypothetical protein [Provencibacterium sp.]